MKTLKTFADVREFQFMELELIQPKWSKKSFELRFDEELVATLEWPTWFRNIAYGRTEYGELSIKRTGLFHPKVTVRRKGSKTDLYVVKMDHYQKGDLPLESRNLKWKVIDMWKSEMGWIENQRDIMLFKLCYSFSKKRNAKIRMIKTDFSDEELSVLLLTGLYLINYYAQYNGI